MIAAVAKIGGLIVGAALVASLAPGCDRSEQLDRVVLQLDWFHLAEFAGYYVAFDKGFYEEQGLEVTILEGGPGTAGRREVLDGVATFGVTTLDIQRSILANDEPIATLMAEFQIPPPVIFSLASSSIHTPTDLAGKKVGVYDTGYHKDILRLTLSNAGLDPGTTTEVLVEPDQMQLLYEGTVDAWVGYASDEPIKAQLDGHPIHNIFPADYGVGGYEGLLITLEDTVSEKPDLVRRFVQASYDGWRYALEHQDEAAEIVAGWAPDLSVEFHALSLAALTPLIDVPQFPIGWIDAARWEQLMGEYFEKDRPGYTMQFSPAKP